MLNNELENFLNNEFNQAKSALKKLFKVINEHDFIAKKVIKDIPYLLHCVKNPSRRLICDLIEENPLIIEHLKEEHQTPSICLKAIFKNIRSLAYIKNKTPTLCMIAVNRDGMALQYIKKEQTFKIADEAVNQNPEAIKYVNDDLKYLFND